MPRNAKGIVSLTAHFGFFLIWLLVIDCRGFVLDFGVLELLLESNGEWLKLYRTEKCCICGNSRCSGIFVAG